MDCGLASAEHRGTWSHPAHEGARSSLHTHHLLQGMQDLGQIVVIGQHHVDVLVSARNLVDHALVLAADRAFGLLGQVTFSELLFGCGTAHASAGIMGAGAEALWVALSANNVAMRPHAAGHNAQLTFTGANRPLTGHLHTSDP